MGGWLSLVVLALAGFAALHPGSLAWVYFAAVGAFEAWLFAIVRSVGNRQVAPGEAPYLFTEDEARLVSRYPFYFTFPGISKHAASVLAAIGLSSVVLAPWFTFRMAYVPALIAAANLLPAGWLTRRVAPMLSLGMAANRGNREALQMIAAHGSAWEKIRRCNIEPKEPAA
ncbi:MAG TPA: hypothetical protein VF211_13595 [Burkholderiales bacterium]